MARTRRRTLVGVALVVVVLVAGRAGPVGADPASPTDYESRVLEVDPKLPDGFEVRVVGGDAFLELRVPRGHTAEVPDYGVGNPPYLRFRADGTVERNANATATSLNESRYRAGDGTSPGGRPRWEVVARDGRYLWHDHRIHWMSPIRATGVDGGDDGRVDMGGPEGTWEIELDIDATPTLVTGELVLHPARSAGPWLALLALTSVVLVVVAFVGARRRPARGPRRLLAGALLCGSVLALATSAAEWRSLPGPAAPGPLSTVIAAVAVIAAAIALVSSRASVQRAALAASIASLGGWAWLRREVLTRAVLPTRLPDPLDRTTTALALGVALAGAVILVWFPPRDAPGPKTAAERSDAA